jgi:hypothetical protein
LLRLYTTDPLNPMELSGNSASNVGGGIYLRAGVDDPFYNGLGMRDVNLVDNSARNGAAIYADDYDVTGPSVFTTAVVEVNSPIYIGMPSQTQRCAVGIACNQISGNVTQDINGNRVDGAIVYVSAGGWWAGAGLRMQHNQGAQLFFLDDDSDVTRLFIGRSLLTDNDLSNALIHKNREATLSMYQTTVARNQIGAAALVIADQGGFNLKYSIIDQPDLAVYSGNNAAGADVDYVLTQDAAVDGYGSHVIFGTPIFFNAAGSDYRLRASSHGSTIDTSSGIDVAAPFTGDDRDIDNRPFDQDVAEAPDGDGVRDLGALEAQPIQGRIFTDGFGDEVQLVH